MVNIWDHFGHLWTISEKNNYSAPKGQSRVWRRCFGAKNQFLFEFVQKGPDGPKKGNKWSKNNWVDHVRPYYTLSPPPSLNKKIDSGNTHLQDLAQWWRTSKGLHIPKISQLFWRFSEKTRFLCFYNIKSMARKGYFGPKSDFKGSKIPPRGASSTWNMYYYMWDTCTSHFGPKKFDRVGRGGQRRSKYGPEWALPLYIFGLGAF